MYEEGVGELGASWKETKPSQSNDAHFWLLSFLELLDDAHDVIGREVLVVNVAEAFNSLDHKYKNNVQEYFLGPQVPELQLLVFHAAAHIRVVCNCHHGCIDARPHALHLSEGEHAVLGSLADVDP